VSSTAHLRIATALAGWKDPGAAFTAVIQLGTMAAVLVYFRRDLWNVGRASLKGLRSAAVRRTFEARAGYLIAAGTVPIAVLGYAFRHAISGGARNLVLVASALVVFGVVLGVADRIGPDHRDFEDLRTRDGLLIGLAQALALVPGVSRSGATISAGRFLGFNREAAARYSFLLSVPAVVLSGLFELKDIGGSGGAPVAATVVATVLAFVVGYASIAVFLRLLTRESLLGFAVYRVAAGAVVLGLVAAGAVS
jgi:undecaprenyl-diphosphatase